MKTILNFLLISVFFSAAPAFAGKRCGLGSKLFGHSQGIISQLSEIVTDNAVSGAASISYGTSGCKHDGNLIFDGIGKNDRLQEQLDYTSMNYEELMVEMASGSGETLSGFGELFGCRGPASSAFDQMVRSRYPSITEDGHVSPEKLLYNVRESFRQEMPLRKSCDAV